MEIIINAEIRCSFIKFIVLCERIIGRSSMEFYQTYAIVIPSQLQILCRLRYAITPPSEIPEISIVQTEGSGTEANSTLLKLNAPRALVVSSPINKKFGRL